MSQTVRVRATISMQGIRRGQEALVDPYDTYIARCIERGHLVPLEPIPPRETPEADAEPPAEETATESELGAVDSDESDESDIAEDEDPAD